MNTTGDGAQTAAGAGTSRSTRSARASSRPLGVSYDLLAAYQTRGVGASRSFFFERGGLGVAGTAGPQIAVPTGRGRIARAAADAARLLGSIAVQESGGPAPIVAGVIAFDEDTPSTLSILSDCVIRRVPGAPWRIRIDAAPQVNLLEEGSRPSGAEHATGGAERTAPGAEFEDARVRLEPDRDAYVRAAADAVRRIERGEIAKVVLARSLVLDAGRELSARELLGRLRAVEPDAFTFAVPTPRGVLVGASPELLVARRGTEVRSTPLAGSAPRFGDPDRDQDSGASLLASGKEREEHAIVADAVEAALRPQCEELERDADPVLFGTANVWHLSTRFRGVLTEPAPSALELVGALHPTPAVCGEPPEAARAAIGELEPFDRGCYAGPVGWMDAHGDGEWAIALRCAELRGSEARLFAGAGIVAASDPQRELEETERKFRALLDSLRWG